MSTQEAAPTASIALASQTRLRRLPVHALWLTSFVSLFGNQLTGLAVPWFVLETTGSASRTGLTAAVGVIPYIIASFFGGALVDRVSYRGMSVIADLMSAVTVALIPILHFTVGLNFPTLLLLMFVGALLDAPGSTARTAMVPPLSRLTGISLERINSNFGMIGAFTTLFTAPLAGVLIAWLGAANVLWLNAATFLISAAVVVTAIPPLRRAEPAAGSFLDDVREGVRYVRGHSLLKTIIGGALVINMVFAPLVGVAIPWFANRELQSVQALGIMLGGQGLGSLVGAFLYGRLGDRLPRRTLLLVSLVLLTVPVLPLAFVTGFAPATALLVILGIGTGMVNPMLITFMQTTTPEQYLGRVMGMLGAGASVAQPIGLILGGSLLGYIGFTGFTSVVALVMALVSVAIFLAPSMHELDAAPAGNPSPVPGPQQP